MIVVFAFAMDFAIKSYSLTGDPVTTKPTLKRNFRSPLVGGGASFLPILAGQEAEI
jgi:hypothetical protein